MKNVSKIIPCYAADTSGVCSALYELGGMVITHDASGCNSTYATHDEPRWYDMQSKIYISALTEIDAIMGNDEKIISDAVSAAKDQNPRFIAVCGSPMPMMTGVDFDAIADEIQSRSGIRTFAMHTNGTRSYIHGASEALLAIVKEYSVSCPRCEGFGVNIIGATPLDLPLGANMEIKKLLENCVAKLVSCIAMGSGIEDISRAAAASLNIVVSMSGLAAAEYLFEKFGTPYFVGVPFDEEFAGKIKALSESDYRACESTALTERGDTSYETVIIGETINALSLASAISTKAGKGSALICPLGADRKFLDEKDLVLSSEDDIKNALDSIKPKNVIADPLYKYIVPGNANFIPIPHFAFSGRCFQKDIPALGDTVPYVISRL